MNPLRAGITNLASNGQGSETTFGKLFNHRVNLSPDVFLAVAEGQHLFPMAN